jgi:transcriptional regulator with XRE-family HTH domain
MLALEYKTPLQILLDVGTRAKSARLKVNMSRKTLSDRSGVTQASIKRFETTGQISLINLVQILIALDRITDLDGLLEEQAVPFIRELGEKKRMRGRG